MPKGAVPAGRNPGPTWKGQSEGRSAPGAATMAGISEAGRRGGFHLMWAIGP